MCMCLCVLFPHYNYILVELHPDMLHKTCVNDASSTLHMYRKDVHYTVYTYVCTVHTYSIEYNIIQYCEVSMFTAGTYSRHIRL